jgi:hypothetical protein
VDAGKIAVKKAAQIADLPEADQDKAVDNPEPRQKSQSRKKSAPTPDTEQDKAVGYPKPPNGKVTAAHIREVIAEMVPLDEPEPIRRERTRSSLRPVLEKIRTVDQ